MIFDIVFGILLLTGVLRGIRRGFAGQVIHVGGIVLGVMFAGMLTKYTGSRVEPYLTRVPVEIRPSVMHIIALLAIVLVVWIVGGIALARYRVKALGAPVASGQDRMFGAALGLLTNAVLICLLIEAIEHLPKPIRETDFVSVQMHQSLGVQWSQKIPIAPWIAKVPEVQDLFEQVKKIAEHFRPTEEKPVDELKKAAEDLIKLE